MPVMKLKLVNNSSHSVGGCQIRSYGNIPWNQRNIAKSFGAPLPEAHLGWEMLWQMEGVLEVGQEMTIEFESYALNAFLLTEHHRIEGGDDMGSTFKMDLKSSTEHNNIEGGDDSGSEEGDDMESIHTHLEYSDVVFTN